ncbi:MAG TPA: LuxR C-terminal-related transcriptional regulator [Pseudolysinimonas sp.]|nr:LuxR C-terminal-related transcriptional regulator [Pseudolysinimonas sp.]
MPVQPDIAALRSSLNDAVARSDAPAVRDLLGPVAHALAIEDGVAFRDLVSGMPDALWHGDVRITAAMGSSYRSAGSPPGSSALAYFVTAERLAAPDRAAHPTRWVSVLTAYGAALRSQGRLRDAQHKLDEAAQVLAEADHGPAFVVHSARFELEYGVVDLLLGRLESARHRLEFAHGLASQLTLSERLECVGALALVAYSLGDLPATDRMLAEADALDAPDEVLGSGFAAPLYATRILVTTDRHELADLAATASALVAASVHTEWEPLAGVVAAYAQALQGEPIAALDLLHHAHQRYLRWQAPGIGRDVGDLLRADILSALDRGEEAFRILADLDPHERHALCPERFMARLALQHGDLHGADTALADCELLGEGHSPRTMIDVQLLRAAIEMERGNLGLSDVSFDRALHAMAQTRVRSPFRHIPASLLDRLTRRGQLRKQSPEVRRILGRVLEYTAGHDDGRDPLSERERLVLVYVERKLTVAQIAAELFISPNTVKTHLRRLYRKLGVSTREEAIRRARSLGLHLGTRAEITRQSPAHRGTTQGDTVV